MDETLRADQQKRDGDYFLAQLRTEVEHLHNLIDRAESELEIGKNVPEEACGKLRVAAGKAKLLMNRKFDQFEELCKRNMGIGSIKLPNVTNDDLAGYWDVVLIQISQIQNLYDQSYELISKNRENNN